MSDWKLRIYIHEKNMCEYIVMYMCHVYITYLEYYMMFLVVMFYDYIVFWSALFNVCTVFCFHPYPTC